MIFMLLLLQQGRWKQVAGVCTFLPPCFYSSRRSTCRRWDDRDCRRSNRVGRRCGNGSWLVRGMCWCCCWCCWCCWAGVHGDHQVGLHVCQPQHQQVHRQLLLHVVFHQCLQYYMLYVLYIICALPNTLTHSLTCVPIKQQRAYLEASRTVTVRRHHIHTQT